MQSLRRTAATAARKGRTTLPRQPRRYAHDEHAHAHHAHHPPVNEGFGPGFWGTLAVIPAGWALYYVSRPNADSPSLITRLINDYTDKQDRLAAINDVHVRALERAGSDRVLFMKTRPQEYVDLRFPEMMNNGSPYNVPAGSQANINKAIEKYKKISYEENERKLEALRTNSIKSEQPFEREYGPQKRGARDEISRHA